MDGASDRRLTQRSRALRANATPAERALWQRLRSRQLADTRFNRQVPIGPFICDFVARTPKLVIELDGGQHASLASEDSRRTTFLQEQGYRVLRFWNNDVLENMDGVLDLILEALTNGPSPCPSRKAGGEI